MNSISKFVFIGAILTAQVVLAGHAVGNGGDYIRSTFLQVGEACLKYLGEDPAGQDLTQKNKLDLVRLEQTLDVAKISVTESVLIDNTGSLVDALGKANQIVLNQKKWADHFENERDVYFLVLHEMLRSAAIKDDNYIVSAEIRPFPAAYQVATRAAAAVPLIDSENLEKVLDIKKLVVNGTGCPQDQLQTFVKFDSERNQIVIAPRSMNLNVGGTVGRKSDRKSCQLAIPMKAPAQYRLIVSQLDMSSVLNLNKNTSATLKFEVFSSGQANQVFSKVYQAKQTGLSGRALIRENQILATECGVDSNLRLNSSAVLTTAAVDKNSQVSVDEIVLSLKVEKCL